MGHAELRTFEFSPEIAADQVAPAQVTAIFPQPRLVAEPDSNVNPKARRIAALVFVGGVVAFWGGAAAIAANALL